MAAGVAAPFVLRTGALGAGDPFRLGVASGEPTHDGFVIWTRLAPSPLALDSIGGMTAPADVRFEIATDEAMRQVVRRGEARTDATRAHTVNIEIAGLNPDRPYWYRFYALGAASPIGRTRTAPALGAPTERLRLAVASCAHWEAGYFSAYRHMAEENPDLVLFLGDYIYEYSYAASRSVARRHDITGETRTLAQYRNRYALHRTDPDLQALHAAAPCLAVWDDHEVQNDYGADLSQNPTTPDDVFALRRAAAYRAFLEHMPLRSRTPATRLYGRHGWSSLAEIAVLDTRQYRDRHACERANTRRAYVAPLTCADLADPRRSLLGEAQERWLHEGFSTHAARWNIIAQQLLVSPLAQKTSDGAPGAFTDGWSGFAANRQRMLRAMVDSRLSNPVFLGGDLHAFAVSRLTADARDADTPPIASEFVGTSITSDAAPDSVVAAMPDNPHVLHLDNRHRGYLSIDLAPSHMETRLRAISDRADRGASVSTLKRFVVEAGRPGPVEA